MTSYEHTVGSSRSLNHAAANRCSVPKTTRTIRKIGVWKLSMITAGSEAQPTRPKRSDLPRKATTAGFGSRSTCTKRSALTTKAPHFAVARLPFKIFFFTGAFLKRISSGKLASTGALACTWSCQLLRTKGAASRFAV